MLAVHILIGQAPPHEDCLVYNPKTLTIQQTPSNLWLLTDGYDRMQLFVTKADAENGLALASRYNVHCFIGRHASTRPNMTVRERTRYIVHYWTQPTGKQTVISPDACQPYVASALRTEDKGSAGWLVTDGKGVGIAVDNEADAHRVINVARQYTSHCTIGGADTPWPAGRLDYWK